MTDPTIALKQYLINIGLQDDADFLRQGVELLSQMVMEWSSRLELASMNARQNAVITVTDTGNAPGRHGSER